MAILFRNSDLKKLNGEQLTVLGKLADAVGAETLNDQEEQSHEEISQYLQHYKAEAEAQAQQQQSLVNSLV